MSSVKEILGVISFEERVTVLPARFPKIASSPKLGITAIPVVGAMLGKQIQKKFLFEDDDDNKT